MFCTKCGSKIEGNPKFCTQCGSALPVSDQPTAPLDSVASLAASCANCGSPLEADAKFCTTCGMCTSENGTAPIPQVNAAQTATAYAQTPTGGASNAGNANKPLYIGLGLAAVAVVIALIAFFVVDPMNILGKNAEPSNSIATSQQESKSSDSSSSSSNSSSSNSSSSNSSSSSSNESAKNSDYILKDSNSRYYTNSDLANLSDYELYIARNEIFARHGREFKNADLQEHFNKCSWYQVRYTAEEFDANYESMLNTYEKKNSELIRSVEQSRGSSYLK